MNRLLKICRPVSPFSPFFKFSSEATAGVLIIGDEILKGTVDLNSPFLIKELNQINVKVKKVAIVPDCIEAIASEVSDMKSKCTYVFTSGGIGPTHDDVTYEAIAKACNDDIVLNEQLFQFLVNYFGPESRKNPGILKYSSVPKSAMVQYVDLPIDSRIIKYPVVSLGNIYVFPGVPSLLKKCFYSLKLNFAQAQKKYTKEIYINLDEFTVIKILNEAVKLFQEVTFGSYPVFADNYHKVKLVLESNFLVKIEEASGYLINELPKTCIVEAKTDVLSSAKNEVYSLIAVFNPVKEAISIIEQAFEKYSLAELCVCFSGGKDCTALLHLIYACIQKYKPHDWNKVHFLYIKNIDSFKEMDNFIGRTVGHYGLDLTVVEGDTKDMVAQYLKSNNSIKAMFLGTRKDDPGAQNLESFSLTDSDWPRVLRILPIISWSYADVWFFIRTLQLPYCILYDRGYTSVGKKSLTIQNPSLLKRNAKGFSSYDPAYKLVNGGSERYSRS